MSIILHIETSTSVCSVALSDGEKLLGMRESFATNEHASQLTVFIQDLFEATNITPKELSAVSVSKGPGSYTGLRIGVSVAKGIAYRLNIPMVSVISLQAMANGLILENINIKNFPKGIFLCPMIDARRMEVYSAIYSLDLEVVKPVSADIIEENSYTDFLNNSKIVFFGNGSGKCKDVITHPNAIFIDNFFTSSRYMVTISYQEFVKKQFVDIAYFEPYYLKEFIATEPKKKML